MKKRRIAREITLQVLYSLDISNEDIKKIFEDVKKHKKADEKIFEFVKKLSDIIIKNKKELDQIISKNCKNWELQRVAVLDKNILRMAIAEILYFDDIPEKVSIDEAIELGKKYSTEKSGTFINGILDAIAFKDKKSKN